jgi:membrane-associated phospholipid phosphatase
MLLAACACAAVAVAVWFAAFHTATGQDADARALSHIVLSYGSTAYTLTGWIVHLGDPVPFALLLGGLLCLAYARGGPFAACTVAVVLVGANLTTEVLKHLTAAPRAIALVPYSHLDPASWPSGHTTAAATLALWLVILAPAQLRPLAAVAGACFVAAMAAGVMLRASHFPSDVLGALCVAGAWTLVGLAVLSASRDRRTASASP